MASNQSNVRGCWKLNSVIADKKKKKTDCHQMKAGGQHFHQRRAVQTSLTHLIHQHLKVRQPAPRKLSMSHPWSMRLTTTKWENVDSRRLVHMTDIKIQNNWHLRQAKMTFAIPVQWKRDYENPRAHSNKTTDYSGKYDNVGDGKKERKKLWSHNLRTRHKPRPLRGNGFCPVKHTPHPYTDIGTDLHR